MTEDAKVRANMGLVGHVLARMNLPRRLDRDDLDQVGAIGLLRAIRTYDPDRAAFSTYAVACIRTAIVDELRRNDHLTRTHRKSVDPADRRWFAPLSLDAPAGPNTDRPRSDYLVCNSNRRTVEHIVEHIDLARELGRLPERARGIVAGHALDVPQDVMAVAIGVSQERVRQILVDSLDRVRRRLLPRPSPEHCLHTRAVRRLSP